MLEHELLLNCARTKFNPEGISGIDLDALDWDYVLRQSKLHNIAPLVHNSLRDFSVPIRKQLQAIYAHTGFHNMLYLEELKKAEEKFKRHGVKVIVLKGPALALEVYGNIALRPFVDVDILMRKEDLPETETLLNSLGYLCEDPEFYKRYHFHLPCAKKGKIDFFFELHWAFVDRFILNRVDMSEVRELSVDGMLPPEINILYLLLHIEKHAFLNKIICRERNPAEWIFSNPRGNQLIWYTDLYELISGNEIDWQSVTELSREWAMQHIVYHNLHILNQLYPLHQVEDVLRGMPRYKIGLLKRLIYVPALRKNSAFTFSPDIQLRPIRALDLVDYVFPSPGALASYYRIAKRPMLAVYYVLHIITGLKEILREFLGICQKKLYANRKREYPARG